MTTDDRVYYGTRALQEDKAALDTSCPAARARHMQMAAMYRERCALIDVLRASEHGLFRQQPSRNDRARVKA